MKSLLRWPVLINAALFQVTWFACVLGSAKGLLWPAVAACALLAWYQLHPARRHPSDLKLVAVSIMLGLLIDSIWVQAGFLTFTDQRPFLDYAPAWIIVLWVAFALTINHSLAWLDSQPWLPAVTGLIGGPLSYLAGLKFGAVEFHAGTTVISVSLAVAWAISLTILVRMRRPLPEPRPA